MVTYSLTSKPAPFPLLRVLALLGFLGLILAVFGVYVRHQLYVQDQQKLYREYLKLNEWRSVFPEKYEALRPLLDSVERADPDSDSIAKLSELQDRLASAERGFLELPGAVYFPERGPARDLSREVTDLLVSYGDNLLDIRCLAAIRNDRSIPPLPQSLPSYRVYLEPSGYDVNDMSAWQEITIKGTSVTFHPTRKDPSRNYMEAYRREAEKSPAVVKADALIEMAAYKKSMGAARAGLEKVLCSPEQVPRGLDLAYARTLPPLQQ